ncbi:MAG: helical backbone metal receptor [Planctomycetota bacterium]|nr:helical backbone metal receptor [Planctomycetota bacterium]
MSLVPSLTETVCELAAGDRLVGVTRYCVEPEATLQGVPRVGGTKNPDREKIAALQPDIILANTEENRAEDIHWLKKHFLVMESAPTTVAEAAALVRDLGQILEAREEAEAILLLIEAQLARAEVESLDREAIRVFYPIWKKPWMTINGNTYIHDILERAGAVNVAADRPDRYPTIDPSEFRGLRVELVLLPDEPWVFDEQHRQELVACGWFDAPILLVDGKDFSWHGARTGPGLGRVTDLLVAHRLRGGEPLPGQ